MAQLLIALSPLSLILVAYAAAEWLDRPIQVDRPGAGTNRLGLPLHVLAPAEADRRLFGAVPSVWLQERLVDGAAHWCDAVAAPVYVSHVMAIPIVTALVWFRMRDRFTAWVVAVLTFGVLGFGGYVAYPAAPPWLASREHLIGPVHRLSAAGWDYLHLGFLGRVVDAAQGGSNPVAAMPSLHAGSTVLVALFLWPVAKARWRVALLGYVLLMGLTLVYTGEHYVADVAGGWLTAVVAVAVARAPAAVRSRLSATPAPVALTREADVGGDEVPEQVMASARGLVDQLAPDGTAHSAATQLLRLCQTTARFLRVDGAAVTLMGEDGGDGVAAATDDSVRRLVEMQFTAGEGPCLEAFEHGRAVLVPDVEAMGGAGWPGYLSLAVEGGLGSVFVLPLHVGAARFGVLSIFHSSPRALEPGELAMLLAFARLATQTVMDHLPTGPAGRQHPDGQQGLDSLDTPALLDSLDYRALVYQAQGMVMISRGISLAEALARMRAHAFAHSTSLNDLAQDIVDGRGFSEDEI